MKKPASRAAENKVEILGWCLMTNHVHLVLLPLDDGGISKLLRMLQSEFAKHVNQQSERLQGHLWQVDFIRALYHLQEFGRRCGMSN